MRQAIKSTLLRTRAGTAAYGLAQRIYFETTYRRRRERYALVTQDQPEAHSNRAAVARYQAALTSRGALPKGRARGDVHTYVYVPSHWPHQNHVARGADALGPVTRFDYAARGVSLLDLRGTKIEVEARRQALMKQLLQDIGEAHARRPVDWFFSYALGWDLTVDALRTIKDTFGIPTVNISLDDKNWWDEVERGDPSGGLRNLAPHFDLCWTSARSVLPWYWAEGGQAVFLPEGVDTNWFRPLPECPADIGVGFVGNNFGNRARWIGLMRKARIDVVAFGHNWPSGMLNDQEMLRFFNRCRINLGIGDVHFSPWITNLKGRDFEIPSVGRGVYVTTYNSDLARCFDFGNEITTYRGIDELIELVRYHLAHVEEGQAMAARARQRCIAEHQWEHRFETIASLIGVLGSSGAGEAWLERTS